MPRKNDPPGEPTPRRLHTLKDGFWEDTAVYLYPDGTKVVRKANKPANKPGPWALRALREEIRYLSNAEHGFPPLLCCWDDEGAEKSGVGFEIPFYEDHHSVADFIAKGAGTQEAADDFQYQLVKLLFLHVHQPVTPDGTLCTHLQETLTSTVDRLGQVDAFRPAIAEPSLRLNGTVFPGLQALIEQTFNSGLVAAIDEAPHVRLHGDLILENILIPKCIEPSMDALILIDPVSVAGLSKGPPLMDLVKYESYAKGELLAVRSEWLQAGPTPEGYSLVIEDHHPQLQLFRRADWSSAFRKAFIEHYGPINQPLYHLLEAYYALVMAVNTTGKQQWARILSGIQALHHALTAAAA